MRVIDRYVAEFDAVLRGPRQAKNDLLTEMRDHLIDSTEAHQRGGLDPEAAQRRAVREFGELDELVPEYQTELGLAQGRRTALLVLWIFVAQPFIWGYLYRWVSWTSVDAPRSGYALADSLVEWLGGVTMLASILVVAAYEIGVRYLGVRRVIIRATGVFAYAVAAVFATFGFLMTFVLNPDNAQLPPFGGLLWTAVFLVLPLTMIALSARRCLAVSSQLDLVAARPR